MNPWQDRTMTVQRRVVGPAETCHRCGEESARIQTDENDEGIWWCEDCYENQNERHDQEVSDS